MTESTPFLDQVEEAHRTPGLIGLVSLLSSRIHGGQSAKALAMLEAVGIHKRRAFKMIEEWPPTKAPEDMPAALVPDHLAIQAVWFIQWMKIEISQYDWDTLLKKAAIAAKDV